MAPWTLQERAASAQSWVHILLRTLQRSLRLLTHKREGELDWHRNSETSHDKGYSTDLIGREAAVFIDESPADKPFFLYVPFNAPHNPFQAKAADIAKYAQVKEENRRIYSAMVDSMDQAIGVVLGALEQKKVADNTFVLFFSDNGAVSVGNNKPWQRNKSTNLQ